MAEWVGVTSPTYAKSAPARSEWKEKLEEAVGLRKVVQESNKVFKVETLSSDTHLVPSMGLGADRGERGAAGGRLGGEGNSEGKNENIWGNGGRHG
ncbi:hypothetical protein C8R41DRAFT_925605 [Lentinula lateritia]|uniref:Uncharacterized protein n=1 Tax=Lentinula lateritia TaxID=40482 RepID=A0ABQ8V2U3_9AGAR|nr:hypothetical protein C8R41DRAFT_925605 [Lentinula lateritia]